MAERTKAEAAAPGLAGGTPGTRGAVLIDGVEVDPKRQHILNPASTVVLRTPGGGGFGPPADRDPRLAMQDREDGVVTETSA
jgi:N-methylhydantoinase B